MTQQKQGPGVADIFIRPPKSKAIKIIDPKSGKEWTGEGAETNKTSKISLSAAIQDAARAAAGGSITSPATAGTNGSAGQGCGSSARSDCLPGHP